LAAVGAGLLVRETLIRGSTEAGGRKLAEITRYSAHVGDLFSRHLDHGRSEQFTFLGWLAPLLALAGLILLLRARRHALGALPTTGRGGYSSSRSSTRACTTDPSISGTTRPRDASARAATRRPHRRPRSARTTACSASTAATGPAGRPGSSTGSACARSRCI